MVLNGTEYLRDARPKEEDKKKEEERVQEAQTAQPAQEEAEEEEDEAALLAQALALSMAEDCEDEVGGAAMG